VPRSAPVVLVAAKVEQGGRMKGSDLIQLKANSITVGGRPYAMVTNLAETKSAGEGKKTTQKLLEERDWERLLAASLAVAKELASVPWPVGRAARLFQLRASLT
jgi:hypothetical protein